MKHHLLHFCLFLLVASAGLSGPTWLFICSAVVYLGIYTSLELIFLGVVIDAYYGYGGVTYFAYTLSAAVGVIVMQWVRPRLWIYNQ